MEVSMLIKNEKLVMKFFDDDGNEVWSCYRRMGRENEPFTSCRYGEKRGFDEMLLDLGIDDEDLISALDSLEDGADEVMQALFYLTH